MSDDTVNAFRKVAEYVPLPNEITEEMYIQLNNLYERNTES